MGNRKKSHRWEKMWSQERLFPPWFWLFCLLFKVDKVGTYLEVVGLRNLRMVGREEIAQISEMKC